MCPGRLEVATGTPSLRLGSGRDRDAAAGPRRTTRGHQRVTEVLRRRLGGAVNGPPIFGGLRSQGFPGHPLGDLWRAADLLREHRGDSHVIAWVVGGADAVEILLLTEGWWGLPARSFIPSRGWQRPT